MIRKKHTRMIRWTHWVNFPILFLMIWSGLLIYWANDVYQPLFPRTWYQFLAWDHRLAEGMGVHFTLMWLVAANGVIYLSYLAISGEWRERVPRPHHFKEAWKSRCMSWGSGVRLRLKVYITRLKEWRTQPWISWESARY